jgi:hypothetical protein
MTPLHTMGPSLGPPHPGRNTSSSGIGGYLQVRPSMVRADDGIRTRDHLGKGTAIVHHCSPPFVLPDHGTATAIAAASGSGRTATDEGDWGQIWGQPRRDKGVLTVSPENVDETGAWGRPKSPEPHWGSFSHEIPGHNPNCEFPHPTGSGPHRGGRRESASTADKRLLSFLHPGMDHGVRCRQRVLREQVTRPGREPAHSDRGSRRHRRCPTSPRGSGRAVRPVPEPSPLGFKPGSCCKSLVC